MFRKMKLNAWVDKMYPLRDLFAPPSQDQVSLSQAEVNLLKVAFVIVLIFSIFDMVSDFKSHYGMLHLGIDVVLISILIFALLTLLYRVKHLDQSIVKLQYAYFDIRKDAEKFQIEKSLLLKGFGECIDAQLEKWKLTQAEKEIALLLLKGFSHHEIADVRHTSERTVRQQSLNVYSKSGVRGRSDLAAYFLEDILAPPLITKDKT